MRWRVRSSHPALTTRLVRGTVRKPRTTGGGWSYRLDLGVYSTGKRAQKQLGGFATKKEAQAALSEALTGVQRGTYIAPSRQTLGEYGRRQGLRATGGEGSHMTVEDAISGQFAKLIPGCSPSRRSSVLAARGTSLSTSTHPATRSVLTTRRGH